MYDANAEHKILEVQAMFGRIIAGKVPVTENRENRGVMHEFWLATSNPSTAS
jgi:hypothetical protein